jgi:hypothetical protein
MDWLYLYRNSTGLLKFHSNEKWTVENVQHSYCTAVT